MELCQKLTSGTSCIQPSAKHLEQSDEGNCSFGYLCLEKFDIFKMSEAVSLKYFVNTYVVILYFSLEIARWQQFILRSGWDITSNVVTKKLLNIFDDAGILDRYMTRVASCYSRIKTSAANWASVKETSFRNFNHFDEAIRNRFWRVYKQRVMFLH